MSGYPDFDRAQEQHDQVAAAGPRGDEYPVVDDADCGDPPKPGERFCTNAPCDHPESDHFAPRNGHATPKLEEGACCHDDCPCVKFEP